MEKQKIIEIIKNSYYSNVLDEMKKAIEEVELDLDSNFEVEIEEMLEDIPEHLRDDKDIISILNNYKNNINDLLKSYKDLEKKRVKTLTIFLNKNI